MKLIRVVLLVLLLGLMSAVGIAQDSQSEQLRALFHPTFDIKNDWYGAFWVVGNTRTEIPDNINFFAGVGRRFEKGSIEFMLWKQFNPQGGFTAFDLRIYKVLDKDQRWSINFEVSPYLDRIAIYNFLSIERQVWKRISVGGEMENIYRKGVDSIGGGPRVTIVLLKGKDWKLVDTTTYEFRNDIRFLRNYLGFHIRIRRD